MKVLLWIGIVMVVIGGASFFLFLPPNTANPVHQGISYATSLGDRHFSMSARICLFVLAFGVLVGGAVAHEE